MVSSSESSYSSDSIDSTGDEGYHSHQHIRAGMRGNNNSLIPYRSNASPGYWLCILLPMAFATRYMRATSCAPSLTYDMLSIAAAGMGIESICFFMYMFLNIGLLPKLLISFIPGILTSCLYKVVLAQGWPFGVFWGFGVTFCYQNVYIHIMRGFPRCFSFGEATIIVQGLMLFILNSILHIMFPVPISGEFNQLNAIMMHALFFLLISCLILCKFRRFRKPVSFYILLLALVITVTCSPMTKPIPIFVVWNFIMNDPNRLYIILFYIILVGLTIITVRWQLRNTEKASTSVRKIFHLLILLVFVPGLLHQCAFLYIASGVALAVFTILELMRILEIPPLGNSLKKAFASFSDEKDSGILALTPFSLLIGCALPIWIHPCPCGSNPAMANTGLPLLQLMSGLLATGVGDAAASVIGSKFGRSKWHHNSRSFEGTFAFIVSIMLSIIALYYADYIPMTHPKWFISITATIITALVEAHTDQIDNLVLPLVFYTLISLGPEN
ncbi:dolichol kinase [Teleopsis dalmanni]|uniref:dolichol kinase n=1 Tax=Teleopsis dalmanni TaxID=139649 RepID=UPI0018CD0A03|nr:dolichol kinase [Teleopsis dalmanni]